MKIEVNDLVEIDGSLYKGKAIVTHVWDKPSGKGYGNPRDKPSEPYPQWAVLTDEKKTYHYNADDISKIKVVGHVQPKPAISNHYNWARPRPLPPAPQTVQIDGFWHYDARVEPPKGYIAAIKNLDHSRTKIAIGDNLLCSICGWPRKSFVIDAGVGVRMIRICYECAQEHLRTPFQMNRDPEHSALLIKRLKEYKQERRAAVNKMKEEDLKQWRRHWRTRLSKALTVLAGAIAIPKPK